VDLHAAVADAAGGLVVEVVFAGVRAGQVQVFGVP
jgi:hypothetical protein